MTYVFEKETAMGTLVVEYTLSSVSNTIKVVEMTLGGKYHRLNWMGRNGQSELVDELERQYLDNHSPNLLPEDVMGEEDHNYLVNKVEFASGL